MTGPLRTFNLSIFVTAFLHDIQVRVGQEDILAGDNTGEIWEKNALCAQKDGFLNAGKNEISCTQEVNGTYVSIQITKPCTDDQCVLYDTNVLSLCDVEVIGH